MLKFSSQTTSLTSLPEFDNTTQSLSKYLQYLDQKRTTTNYDFPESSIILPNDDTLLAEVKSIHQHFDSANLGAVVVIGIGGSNLGAWTIYDALKHKYNLKPIWFLETVDPIQFQKTLAKLQHLYRQGKHAIICVISKSGGTTETIANYGALIAELIQLDRDWQQHVLTITSENSPLWVYAKENHLETCIHEDIGGRYSVLSSAGLIPLAISGIDIERLRLGAKNSLNNAFNPQGSIALTSAASIYLNLKNQRPLHNTFIFTPQLATFGRWYRQLVGESLGKEGKGITPLISIGSTDLHSVAQLYLGGPDDKFTTFITTNNLGVDFDVTHNHNLSNVVADIEGKSLTEIMRAIEKAVKTTYAEHRLPYVEIELENLDEETIGELMQMKMCETMLLGKLLNVNAFDQPDVEGYKNETRKLLKHNEPS